MSSSSSSRIGNRLIMSMLKCYCYYCYLLLITVNGTKDSFIKTFDLNLKNAEVAACLQPPLDVEKLDTCLNSSSNNVKKWSYLPDSGECAFLSAAEECVLDNGNEFANQDECHKTCFYAKCFTSPASTACEHGAEETDFWFYNPINGSCVRYADGKCPSNANGFEHEMDCYAACSKASCATGQRRGGGDCQGRSSSSPQVAAERWFMNMTSGQCQRYSAENNCPSNSPDAGYGDGGNSNNNYASEKECVDMCHCKEEELPGMLCHPSLKNLKINGPITTVEARNKTSIVQQLLQQQTTTISTKLPENLFTTTTTRSISSTTTTMTTKKNTIFEATVDSNHVVDHNKIDEHHEHHHHNDALLTKSSSSLISLYLLSNILYHYV